MWERLRAELEAERIVNENNNRTFQTKSECDAARRAILSPYSCLKFDCHCMGHDAEGGGSSATTMDPTTNPYFAGPQQGVAFSPANEADQIKQWVKDYYKQNGIDYDEAYLDELFENMYARKEFEQMFVQAHSQMMEMENRESYLGEADSIKQRYLVTTKSGYIYEELNMKVEERTVANPVSLDAKGMPHLDLSAINPQQTIPDMNTTMDQPEFRSQPYTDYFTDISDERQSNFGQSLANFLNENTVVYAVEQYSLDKIGEIIDNLTLAVSKGLATIIEMPAYPLVVAQNIMNAEVDFCKDGMDAILWLSKQDITDHALQAYQRKTKRATINFTFNLAGTGGDILEGANFLYNAKYGKN